MNQQPNQQQQPQQQGQQGQVQNRTMNIQPAQIQQLAKQCNYEFTEAKRLGLNSEAGQEHLKRAQRIKQVLVSYQQQQRNASLPKQSPVAQSPQVAPQSQPQAQVQQSQSQPTQSPQISQQSPQLNQNQINQRSFSQQSPLTQQQTLPQQTNGVNSSGATASPSPMPQAIGTPAATGGASAPNAQAAPKTAFQQLQRLKHVLNEFQKQLKNIEEAKKNNMLPPEALNKLLQQEQVLRERHNSYKNAALNISQQLQRQQQQMQQQQQQNFQQQSRSQSANQLPQEPSSSQGQSPVVMNQQAQLNPGIQRSTSAASIQRPQGQIVPNQTNNFQFQQQQQQSPQVTQQQLPQQQAQRQAQTAGNQIPNQQQRQIPPQQIPQKGTIGTPQQQQQQIQGQVPNQTQAQQAQARSNLQSRTGTPQPQVGAVVGRSASPNTPVTNVNAAAKPTGTNGNIINPAQAANVFKSSVSSIAIPNQINVKPPAAVSINQNRPSLTGGHGLSAPALTTPALMKLPPYEMQSDRVLSKRKLSELVKTVGADEGDGETTIDGDVEELLLDLADEFVTNVTAFACRLAKHRKSDNLDVKDVQLNLEKNWNIRIPGYSSDEIRSVRKWAPSNAHNQRISGIEISKSVEQNK